MEDNDESVHGQTSFALVSPSPRVSSPIDRIGNDAEEDRLVIVDLTCSDSDDEEDDDSSQTISDNCSSDLSLTGDQSHSSCSLDSRTLKGGVESNLGRAPGGVLSIDYEDDVPVPKKSQKRKEDFDNCFQEPDEDPRYAENNLDQTSARDDWFPFCSQNPQVETQIRKKPRSKKRFDNHFSKREQKVFQKKMDQFFKAHPELKKENEADREVVSYYLVQAGYPFSLQQATLVYKEDKRLQKRIKSTSPCYDGLKVIKRFDGEDFEGTVINGSGFSVWDSRDSRWVRVWRVRFTDGDKADFTYEEIMKYRKDNPRPSPQNRPLRCLELFAGQCVVSGKFVNRDWEAVSVDILRNSNASLKMDLMDFDVTKDLHYVPDFIWASPPCQTYSRAACDRHRSRKTGQLSKSATAHQHDILFVKMMEILRWAKKWHPHVIVCIENPVGNLQHMPLMDELKEQIDLCDPATIHYCAFGREEMKPTQIWTNDADLRHRLSKYTCKRKCTVDQQHLGVQGNTQNFDFSAIPEHLATLVARHVDGQFHLLNIEDKDAVPSSAT